MLRNLVGKNKGLFKIIMMALISVIIVFELIETLGSNTGNAAFNTGNFLGFVIYGGLLGVLLYCLIASDKHTKWIATVCLSYVVISTVLGIPSPFRAFYDGNNSINIASAVFSMLAIFSLIAIITLEVIRVLRKKSFELVFDILVIAYIAFLLLAWGLLLAYYAQVNVTWVSIMGTFSAFIFIPCLTVIGYLYMTTKVAPTIRADEELDEDEIIEDVKELEDK